MKPEQTAWDEAIGLLRAFIHAQSEQEGPDDRKASLALLLCDALTNTLPQEPGEMNALASGVALLESHADPTDAEERELCHQLLDGGWQLTAAFDVVAFEDFWISVNS